MTNPSPPLLTPRKLIQMVFFTLVVPLLPLLISWRWDWAEGRINAAILIGGFIVSRALAARRNPDLIRERAQFMDHADTISFDRVLAPLLGLGGVAALVVAGLDERLGWSGANGLAIKVVALIVMLAGYVLGSWALVVNRYFSGVVRLQTDRGQTVVSSGPYAWVRHPGYVGGLLTYLATPAFLDAAWAYLPVALLAVVIVVRTALEDRTLQAQLPGYADYARRVRYRLLPGVW